MHIPEEEISKKLFEEARKQGEIIPIKLLVFMYLLPYFDTIKEVRKNFNKAMINRRLLKMFLSGLLRVKIKTWGIDRFSIDDFMFTREYIDAFPFFRNQIISYLVNNVGLKKGAVLQAHEKNYAVFPIIDAFVYDTHAHTQKLSHTFFPTLQVATYIYSVEMVGKNTDIIGQVKKLYGLTLKKTEPEQSPFFSNPLLLADIVRTKLGLEDIVLDGKLTLVVTHLHPSTPPIKFYSTTINDKINMSISGIQIEILPFYSTPVSKIYKLLNKQPRPLTPGVFRLHRLLAIADTLLNEPSFFEKSSLLPAIFEKIETTNKIVNSARALLEILGQIKIMFNPDDYPHIPSERIEQAVRIVKEKIKEGG